MDGAGGGGGRALRWSCVCVCTAHLSHVCVCTCLHMCVCLHSAHLSHTGNIGVAAVSTLRATTRAISLIHLDTPSVLGGTNKASTKSQELVELSKLVMSRLNRNQNLTEEATSCLQGAE